jgi:hypothetical protein
MPGGLQDQVNARRKKGENICCVVFKLNCGDINLNLPSRDCPTFGGGGGRKPNVKKEFILDERGEERIFKSGCESGDGGFILGVCEKVM